MNIARCTLEDVGDGSFILTIPNVLFGDKSSQMVETIRKDLYPQLHDGAYPAWGKRSGEAYQVKIYDREKAGQLVGLIKKWIAENVGLKRNGSR
jgi:hypothetical protein